MPTPPPEIRGGGICYTGREDEGRSVSTITANPIYFNILYFNIKSMYSAPFFSDTSRRPTTDTTGNGDLGFYICTPSLSQPSNAQVLMFLGSLESIVFDATNACHGHCEATGMIRPSSQPPGGLWRGGCCTHRGGLWAFRLFSGSAKAGQKGAELNFSIRDPAGVTQLQTAHSFPDSARSLCD